MEYQDAIWHKKSKAFKDEILLKFALEVDAISPKNTLAKTYKEFMDKWLANSEYPIEETARISKLLDATDDIEKMDYYQTCLNILYPFTTYE